MSTAKKKSRKGSSASDPVVPDKLYFRIGEVARICRLQAYVLRFWETEFPLLKPVKSSTGQRMYRQRDVENVLRIKRLLYDQGLHHCRRTSASPGRSETGALAIGPALPQERLAAKA